jgi:N-acetyl-alpha-D-muramate 1-phosphate uridylyltransferase
LPPSPELFPLSAGNGKDRFFNCIVGYGMSAWPPPVAILAGGLATRLRPITEKIPKSLLPVADRPFLAHQLELLRCNGIERVVLCVGHLGEMIEEEFGDGAHFGVHLDYSFDGARLLGTGGAVRKALPLLGSKFFVLYGDSYLPIDYRAVADAFLTCGQPALMTVHANDGKWDTSNVWFAEGHIRRYDKRHPVPEMRHIDYGLSLFDAAVFQPLPLDQPVDLADVLRDLVAQNNLMGYEVRERFYEIGSPDGLKELDALFRNRQLNPKKQT